MSATLPLRNGHPSRAIFSKHMNMQSLCVVIFATQDLALAESWQHIWPPTIGIEEAQAGVVAVGEEVAGPDRLEVVGAVAVVVLAAVAVVVVLEQVVGTLGVRAMELVAAAAEVAAEVDDARKRGAEVEATEGELGLVQVLGEGEAPLSGTSDDHINLCFLSWIL